MSPDVNPLICISQLSKCSQNMYLPVGSVTTFFNFTLAVGRCKKEGVKTLVRLFILELWTESLRAVQSWPWKLEIERRERTNLVWFGDESQLFVRLFLYWLARRSVIAQIMKLHFEGCSNMPRSEVGFIKEMNGTLLTVNI